jgi:hypothetical protein
MIPFRKRKIYHLLGGEFLFSSKWHLFNGSNPKKEEIHKQSNLVVNTSETEDLPSQLPKIEQNQLPADCGHPLKRPGIPAVNKVSYQKHSISRWN